ncbi:hypothetical protein [Thalassobacillus sp. C254]|uniref:hypothetical protein n=1 Tax=Thalassobacillus sp. C254 TaxID=1225341 RepID=UPI0022B7381D|nr:hypothetical protein [Thalassobacillus sp. C254]
MNISNILSSVGVPVARLNYSGPETSYVTFFEYNQYSALDADDEEKATHLSFQVNVYSKGNYLSLVEEVKN